MVWLFSDWYNFTRTGLTSGTAWHPYRCLHTETNGPNSGPSGEDQEATTDRHRNVDCHHPHGTHGPTARCSPPAPRPGWHARTYLVPQAWVRSRFEEQRHCPHVAAQDRRVQSRGPILENTNGGVCTMHGKRSKGRETQIFAKSKPTNRKEITRKRLGHQRYSVWLRQGAGRLVGYEKGDFKCFKKNESQVHFTTAIFPFKNYPCQ